MIKTTRLKTSQVPKNITYDLTPQVDGVKQTFELPEKVYDLDQHYVLFNGQVYRNDGNHTFYTISADGMELTTLFDEAPRPGASYVLQFVKTEIAEGDGAASKSYVDGKVADEATARENADIALGQRIDTVIAASDVKDIVGTHADLESYDTSTLGNNDIIKVLADETQSGKISYYRWNATSSQFSLIGSEGPYQMALTAGSNITIDANNEISAIDTTYSNFVGTDGVDAGVAGLVPAPATTDAGKFLKADGTWDTVGGGIDPSTTFWGQSVVNGAVDGSIAITKGGTARIMFRPANYNKGAVITFQSSGIVEMAQMYKIGSSWSIDTDFLRAGTSEFKVRPIVSQMESTPIMPTEGTDYTCKAYVDQVGNTLSSSAPTSSTVGVLGQLLTDTTAMHTYQCTAIDTTDPDNPSYTWTQRW